MRKIIAFIALLIAFGIMACNSSQQRQGMHFSILTAAGTGVDFNNSITETDSLNMFVNEYTYMGGGVGVADFNKDGLIDIFFAGNEVSSALYINKGDLHFENLTQEAGLTTSAWCTGVSIVDINNDGWPDIYVSVSGRVVGEKRANLLFINQHDLHFKEEAAQYGLADTSYSTQAVFFDYDKDGRLDMYLLNHTLNDNRPNDIRERRVDSGAIAGDKLYHNEGVPPGLDHPIFKDVSAKAGIIEDGNGLGIVVADYNGDGYPDIYVANDYIRNDLLWLNNKNGSFTNCIASSIRHQSYSSMGTDAADINNDGLPDIMTLDMLPETNERKKMMYSFLSDQRRQLEADKGYEPEYIHNMLQVNNGVRDVNGKKEPYFSEIAQMAGVFETDWSWSVLMADLDNDGWKDIHITNGLGRDPTNIDFLEYRRRTVQQTGIPDNDLQQRRGFMEHLASLGPISLHNYLYKNKKNGFQFDDVSMAAGIDQPSISNGAVYADLDNDGDLDIVTNNINSLAFITRNDINNANDKINKTNWLSLQLMGDSTNKDGIGALVYAYSKDTVQMLEQYPVRGYLSSVDYRLHFGLGTGKLDSLKVIWPDGKTQLLLNPAINNFLKINYADAVVTPGEVKSAAPKIFEEITASSGVNFHHAETMFFDYGFQTLLPQKFSQEGPFISTGDMNADGREDFFVGGAYKQSGKIFLQQPNGSFKANDLVKSIKNEEDMQSTLFDVDGDRDLDLLVVSGSSEFEITSSFYRPRLYINDGKGNFKQDEEAFSPLVRTPGKCLAVADFDGDGDNDIFIGGRVALGTYPFPPRSYLLRNDHGHFTDITNAVCPALEEAGLLNAAVWADIDNDKKPELIIAGDWMPIRVFKSNGNAFSEITATTRLQGLPGFWRSLVVADIDRDGDLDIVAGNLGLNNPWHISNEQPAELIAKDFDGNGVTEPIFCYYIKDNTGKYVLSAGISRDEWATQMPTIKKKYDVNSVYAKSSMESIFSPDMMAGAQTLQSKEARSGWFENNGKGSFVFHPFALAAQVAPVNAIAVNDFNNDGHLSILIAGNEYQSQVMAGRYDASYGLLMLGDGNKNFHPIKPAQSGFVTEGDTRDLKTITVGNQKCLLVTVNNDLLRMYGYPTANSGKKEIATKKK